MPTRERPRFVVLRIFGWSFAVTIVALIVAAIYGGPQAVLLVVILSILEISLSFDNAVINATVLRRMSEFWQKIFLTVGMVLLMLFLGLILEEREITWLSWLEKPLARAGKLDQLAVIIAGALLLITAAYIAPEDTVSTVMIAGVLGMVTYIAVNGLGELFNTPEEGEDGEIVERSTGGPTALAKATGKAGFFLFLYLEVLDASFSFDGVIGAFAITSDPILIALGLGL